MRKIQILGAFIAVLAISALAVASAGATLWLKAGESLKVAQAATTPGTITLTKTGGSLGSGAVTCNGTFVGTVGPNGLDEITAVENLTGTEKGLVACTRVSGFCFSPVLHAEKLPWKTELVLEGGVTWDKIIGGAYQFLCAIGSVLCEGPEKSKFIKNTATGPEFEFVGAESGENSCSDAGVGTITGKGITKSTGVTVS